MKTHAERFRFLLEVWGLTQEELGALAGLKRGTVGTIVNGKTTPDVEALVALKKSKPALNWDWLLAGEGEPFRDGRPLGPLPGSPPPGRDYTSNVAMQQTLYIELLKEQVADLKDDKHRLIVENEQLRGKSWDSSDAAGYVSSGSLSTRSIGFLPGANRVANQWLAYVR